MGINVDSVVQTPFSTSVAGVGEKPDASPSITARPATPDRIALSDSGGGSPIWRWPTAPRRRSPTPIAG